MIERKFLAVVRKIEGTPDMVVLKEGEEGTGLTLSYSCGFCCDREGNPTVAFRTQQERNRHTNRCSN